MFNRSDLNALFGLEYNKYGEEHKEIFETETSERSFEEETKLSGFSAAPVKNEGSAIAYDNAQEAFSARYNHETPTEVPIFGHGGWWLLNDDFTKDLLESDPEYF